MGQIELDISKPTKPETSFSTPSSKERLIDLLKKHGIKDTEIIENSEVKLDDVIPTLRKTKVTMPEAFFEDLAAEFKLPFITQTWLKEHCQDVRQCNFLTVLPYRVIETYLVIPLQITPTTAFLMTANPFNRNAMMTIQVLLGVREVQWFVASSKALESAVESVFREIHKQTALTDLYYRHPDQSAYKVLFPNQKYWIIGILIAVLVAATVSSVLTFAVLFAIVNISYFIVNPVKIYISIRGFQKSEAGSDDSIENFGKVKDEDLPVYTVLVPVYHEAAILPQVMLNIYRMNYPKDKMDVKILMEEKDQETLEEAHSLGLFGEPKRMAEGIPKEEYREFLEIFDPVVIPEADITTKPRACNYGLQRATGKNCVIYDAEDSPDPDQLKQAVITFESAGEDVVCLQSKLNFYNASENVLTGWFSIEYSYWYDFFLEGLDRAGVPIPLGGTSNHFRIDRLRELGGWDPYNVTEDADLGLRIARSKLKTAMMESYTYEEATLKVWSWIKQRSRWYKGHVQTYLVHMRHPVKLQKELGAKRFLLFQFTFGGAIFMPVINPILWTMTAISLFAPWLFSSLYLLPVQGLCIFNLVVGNLAYLLMYVAACVKQKKYQSLPSALTMPVYWVLISVAAWRGLIQLITKPFYWEKTLHGVTTGK
jgi:glycosyltransferase XagB